MNSSRSKFLIQIITYDHTKYYKHYKVHTSAGTKHTRRADILIATQMAGFVNDERDVRAATNATSPPYDWQRQHEDSGTQHGSVVEDANIVRKLLREIDRFLDVSLLPRS